MGIVWAREPQDLEWPKVNMLQLGVRRDSFFRRKKKNALANMEFL